MDLLEKTKQLCRLYNITPARSRGQNFLIREEIYDQIIEQTDLQPDDVVLEVGPGLGFLTAKLAACVGRVMAVEIDRKLAEILKTGLIAQEVKNVEVVQGDILKIPVCHSREGGNPEIRKNDYLPPFWIPGQARDDKNNYKIVANLPYNITSIFLRKFLEAEVRPVLVVLMLQKEVAERITARPGEMSLLAVSVQFYAQAEIIRIVPKEFFWPKPEVDSAIIKITPHPRPLSRSFFAGGGRNPPNPLYQGGKSSEKEFFRLVKFGFSAKRKMLKNNLAAGLKIDAAEAAAKIRQAGFNEKIRAQELSVEDWLKLLTVFG